MTERATLTEDELMVFWRVDVSQRHVSVDKLGCKRQPYTREAVGALRRLGFASEVRSNPGRRSITMSGGPRSTDETYFSFRFRRKADGPAVGAAVIAACHGDSGPANRLADQFLSEWPEDCPWRVNINRQIWLRADGRTVTEIWRSMREGVPPFRGTRANIERHVSTLVHAGVVRLSDGRGNLSRQHVYRGAVEPPNDVLRPLVEDWRWPGPDYLL